MPSEKVWTRNFLLIILINFLVFMNHIMVLSTFPMFLEQVLGLNEAVAGAAAFAFSAVAVILRPIIGWLHSAVPCGRRIHAHLAAALPYDEAPLRASGREKAA